MTNVMQPAADDQSSDVFSGVFVFLGVALIILGILAMTFSVFVTLGTVVLLGAFLIAAGIAEFIHVFRIWRTKKVLLNILSALIYLIAGGFTLFHPLAGALSITLIISAFLIGAGLIRCFYAITHRDKMWGWFLFGGILNLILGAMIGLGWPTTGFWLIGLFIGIEMLFHGISWIAFSAVLRRIEKATTSAKP